MHLIFVRHGQTQWQIEKKILGQTDIPLTELGIQQVRDLGDILPLEVEAIYSSPLQRALVTAQIFSEHYGLPIAIREDIQERNVGTAVGKTWEQFSAEVGYDTHARDRAQQYDYRPYGGESAEDMKIRVRRFIAECKSSGRDKILVVTHAGIIRIMYFLYKPDQMPSVKVASIHEFEIG